uniref:Uncharacterized protein n=1 Tax=Rhizophora mucronata TaxID=61149 RepID=A0A2P2MQB4_RHIMU
MERVLDDESEQKVLTALENAGVFTSGGLVKDKVTNICFQMVSSLLVLGMKNPPLVLTLWMPFTIGCFSLFIILQKIFMIHIFF